MLLCKKMNYNTKAWKRKTAYIRRRDNFECVECARRNAKTDAVLTHHINPAEDCPELFWDDRNLISLCNDCHERMHNRINNSLTRLGIFYKRMYQLGGEDMTKIIFVTGAPCSGKSTYVREHRGRNDLVFDLDEVVKAITLNDLHDKNPSAVEYALLIRDLILRRLETETRFDTAWIITTKMHDKLYDYYLYKPEIIEIAATKEICLERLEKNPDRRNFEETKKLIEEYFEN